MLPGLLDGNQAAVNLLLFPAHAQAFVGFLQFGYIISLGRLGEQFGGDAHCPGGIGDMHHCLLVGRVDLHGGVDAAGGGAADHQRQIHAQALHFTGHVNHFIQRRRDQTGQADDIHLLCLGRFQNLLAGYHHAHIDHVVAVTLQYHADDILADIVYIAFYRGHQDLAVGLVLGAKLLLFLFHEGEQVGHGLFHHPGGFHHLGQEHLAFTKQVADHVHAIHERALDHVQGAGGILACQFGILVHVIGDAFHQGMFETLFHVPFTPGQILFLGFFGAASPVFFGQIEQDFGAILSAIKHHVFYGVAKFFGNIRINRQHGRVNNAHVHAIANRVVKEHGMNRFTDSVIAAEGKAHVGNAAGNHGVGQGTLDVRHGFDEVHSVVVVLFNAGGDGKDIGVEDNVFRREIHFFSEQLVGSGTDFHFALTGFRLAFLIKGHDDHCRTVTTQQSRLVQEGFFTFLHGNGVHHPLALDAFQTGLDHFPLGGIDHDRHLGDLRFRCHQVKELHHALGGFQHPLIHVDVDDLGAVLHLVTGHVQGSVVILFLDQAQKAFGAGHIGPLAHVNEQGVLADGAGFQARQPAGDLDFGNLSWRQSFHGLRHGGNVLGGGTAAASDDVEEPLFGPTADFPGHGGRIEIVFPHFVGQASVGVSGHVGLGNP